MDQPTPGQTTRDSLEALLEKLQDMLDGHGSLAGYALPESGHQRYPEIRLLIRQLAAHATPLAGGREVRTTTGGVRRVRGWTLPRAVHDLRETKARDAPDNSQPTSKKAAKGKTARTPMALLHAAIRLGDATTVDWLLRAGFSPHDYAEGRPPMGFAYFDDRPRAVRLLWQHGAAHDHTFRDTPKLPPELKGATQLHRLLRRGQAGLDIDLPDDQMRLRDRCEVARFYVKTYKDPRIRNAHGMSAFDLAPPGDPVTGAALAALAEREAGLLDRHLPDATARRAAPPRM